MFAVDRIVTRYPSDSFDKCVRFDQSKAISVKAARDQYQAYVEYVSSIVATHNQIEQDPQLADCVFIENTAVVLDHQHVVITRPGASSRQDEIKAVLGYFESFMTVHPMEDPATLDGGDVLRVGDTLIVGLSTRTNQEGIDFLTHHAKSLGIKTRSTPLPAGLHFKSFCSLAAPDLLVYDPQIGLDLSVFDDLPVRLLAAPETMGANVLALAPGKVLVSEAAPETAKLLREEGLDVSVINVSEMHVADGALTCPSVRIPKQGAWCT